jgi:acetyl-CoA carboxylase biotin carboxyl carrier protein
MAEKDPISSEPLDVQKIHYLARLMKRYDMTDLDLSDGQVKISLKRRGPESATAPLIVSHSQGYAQPAPGFLPPSTPAVPAPAAKPESSAAPAQPESKTIVIKSPMVGTYYASSSPESPPFVTTGSTIQPDSTVCIIEAMKVFTDIPSGVSGTIAEVLVKNGQPVEFDHPLFRLNPS